MGRTTKTIYVSLPPEMIEEIERLAKAEKKSKSQLFRDAFSVYAEVQRERRWQSARRAGARAASRLKVTSEADIDRLIHEARGV